MKVSVPNGYHRWISVVDKSHGYCNRGRCIAVKRRDIMLGEIYLICQAMTSSSNAILFITQDIFSHSFLQFLFRCQTVNSFFFFGLILLLSPAEFSSYHSGLCKMFKFLSSLHMVKNLPILYEYLCDALVRLFHVIYLRPMTSIELFLRTLISFPSSFNSVCLRLSRPCIRK